MGKSEESAFRARGAHTYWKESVIKALDAAANVKKKRMELKEAEDQYERQEIEVSSALHFWTEYASVAERDAEELGLALAKEGVVYTTYSEFANSIFGEKND